MFELQERGLFLINIKSFFLKKYEQPGSLNTYLLI